LRKLTASLAARLLTALAVAGLLAVAGCSAGTSGGATTHTSSSATGAPETPYDIRPLLMPSRKYIGATVEGVPQSLTPVTDFSSKVGKSPNLLAYYLAWGDQFVVDQARSIWNNGQLPYVAWEPFKRSLAQIADGVDDQYIKQFAASVRTFHVPVAISFAHEMNGHWYPWGTKSATAADFVRAWRHIHDVFQDASATNVIWVWSPNVINPAPKVALQPYYPGDGYVDWIGVVGYYTRSGPHTFDTLFGPTFNQVRTFTHRPFLIAETAAEPGARKPIDIADLWRGVAARDDVIGFIWFDIQKETDWRVASAPDALSAFRRGAADGRFGFDVRQP
jgi:mannan endo-1,4-beta-mannosidase